MFVACAPGAPEADALLQRGFVEGSSNTHPGQGTANRRFFFANFMLELLWLTDAEEATSARTRRTRSPEPTNHRLALGPVKGVSVGVPTRTLLTAASLAAERQGLLTYLEPPEPVLEIHFQGSPEIRIDLRPVLPVVLRIAP